MKCLLVPWDERAFFVGRDAVARNSGQIRCHESLSSAIQEAFSPAGPPPAPSPRACIQSSGVAARGITRVTMGRKTKDEMRVSDQNAAERLELEAQRRELAHLCEQAQQLIERRPDDAALLLDGFLLRIANAWCQHERLPVRSPDEMLARIERSAPPLGWRLRLSLRAPDVRARLVHCQALLEALDEWAPAYPVAHSIAG